MAKRKTQRRAKAAKRSLKGGAPRRSVKRPNLKIRTSRPSRRVGRGPSARLRAGAAARQKPASKPRGARKAVSRRAKPNSLDRARRILEETVPTPPSSLNLRRQGTAARTGRAELAERLREHGSITPAITAGDVDADWENAYFSGDEAPGGDNPTPDQDVVEDIGEALGLKYEDNEELKAADKVVERDKHRWELDPASSEDYKERK
jgi:uncharacterized protein DUF6335